jgi:hypothetical protein
MHADFNTRDIDLSQGEEIVGAGDKTARQIIRETYYCKSRAEEGFFLACSIAS